MRNTIWIWFLFVFAVILAMLIGNNEATVTFYIHPQSYSLSLNFFIIVLIISFAIIYLFIKTIVYIVQLPQNAKKWREQQRERNIYHDILNAFSHEATGRYTRAQKSAQMALTQSEILSTSSYKFLNNPQIIQLSILANLLMARSAHALQKYEQRDNKLQIALKIAQTHSLIEIQDALLLQASQWAVSDREQYITSSMHSETDALHWLNSLSKGAARRTIALRLKLKALQQAKQFDQALHTLRLLGKHKAFSTFALSNLQTAIIIQRFNNTHGIDDLRQFWKKLPKELKKQTDIALQASINLKQLITLESSKEFNQSDTCEIIIRSWLHEAYENLIQDISQLQKPINVKFIFFLAQNLQKLESQWLHQFEQIHQKNPKQGEFTYLLAKACFSLHLWGKSQQLFEQAENQLNEEYSSTLLRDTRINLAILAQQQNIENLPQQYWKSAALTGF